jgi:cytoplasmic tRNA 2-thiolation protein 1
MNKYSMLKHDDKLAIGVSGGKDSLSLLYVLKKFLDRHGWQAPIAVTIDEGVKGYRDESLEIVKSFCSNLKIKNVIISYRQLFGVDIDEAVIRRPTKKMSSCSMCGTFRRRAMDLAAESLGANVIATAHNLDDQLQTFMINMFAGDTERIGWIYPESVSYSRNGIKKIKPFIEIYELEIAFYALQRQIPFQSEECPYMNESIRTDIRRFINHLEKSRPGIKYNAYNSMMKISKDLRSLSTHIDENNCSICGRLSSNEICSVCKTQKTLADTILSEAFSYDL